MSEDVRAVKNSDLRGVFPRLNAWIAHPLGETALHSTLTYANRMLVLAMGLLISVLAARFLGPEGRGYYAVAVTIQAIGVQLANLGLHATNTYTAARRTEALPALAGNSLAVSLLLGGLCSVAGGAFFSYFSELAPIQGAPLWIALFGIPAGLFFLFFQNLLLGLQDVCAYNLTDLASKAPVVLAILALVLADLVSVENVLVCTFGGLLIAGSWAFIAVLRRCGASLIISVALFTSGIRYGIKAYLTALLGFLVLRADLLLVKAFLGAEQTGYYAIALSLTDLLYSLPVAAGMMLFPRLSAMANRREKWALAGKSVRLLAAALFGMVLLAIPLAAPGVRILFGEAYLPAVPAFLWLLPGIFFLGLETAAVQYLNSIGFPREIVFVWALALIVNVGLNLIVIPRFGIAGASAVSSLSYALVCGAVLILALRYQPEKPHADEG